ncbi:hypothetical protein PI125_g8724 [Phytophthora idaei]|nr:hypothetical protein PI125_g8724 [Phytophthora idaei]
MYCLALVAWVRYNRVPTCWVQVPNVVSCFQSFFNTVMYLLDCGWNR